MGFISCFCSQLRQGFDKDQAEILQHVTEPGLQCSEAFGSLRGIRCEPNLVFAAVSGLFITGFQIAPSLLLG